MRNSRFFAALALALSACILVACFPKGYTDKEEKAQINAAVALTEKYTDEYAPDAYISKSDFCVLDRQAEGNPKLYLTDWAEGKFKDSKNHRNYSVYVNTKTGEVYTDHNWDDALSYGRKLFYEQSSSSPEGFFAPLFEQVEAIRTSIAAKEAEIEAYKASFEAPAAGGTASGDADLNTRIDDFESIVDQTETDGSST